MTTQKHLMLGLKFDPSTLSPPEWVVEFSRVAFATCSQPGGTFLPAYYMAQHLSLLHSTYLCVHHSPNTTDETHDCKYQMHALL
jgi:hypothetical protein